ncbi:MAG: UvrD-helicase domain-containing protein, partial [Gammaproteobacteria bacterium]|nr:UvrD-helicase domain-containing protein [Gammaproteobacteria bacterium]
RHHQARLSTQPALLYQQAAERTLQSLTQSPETTAHLQQLLLHLDNRLEQIERLLVMMLAQRDRWLRLMPLTATSQEHDALRLRFEQALTALVEDHLEHLVAIWPAVLNQSAFFALARQAADTLLQNDSQSAITNLIDCQQLPSASWSDLLVWQGLAELLLLAKGQPRQRLDKRQGFPPVKETETPAAKQQLIETLQAATATSDWISELHAVRQLPVVGYDDNQWQVLLSLFEILPRAVANLKVVFTQYHEFDFTEIAHAAQRALGAPEQPTDLSLYLDHRINHILVDEFQDTSHSQIALLEQLTAGWGSSDGHTLFVVGDPMQSIYRFREAEVSLFLQAKVGGIGGVSLQPLQLQRNFRADTRLIDWLNDGFSKIFPSEDYIDAGAIGYRPALAGNERLGDYANHGAFVHPMMTDVPEEQTESIVELVRSARSKDPNQSIAVLVRSRRHLEVLLPALDDADIPVQTVDVEALITRPWVRDLHMLMRAARHLADRSAWLAVLRAPWCGLTLADLSALAENQHDAVWSLIHQPDHLARLSNDGQLRLRWLRSVWADQNNALQQATDSEKLRARWQRLGADALWSARDNNINIKNDLESYFNVFNEMNAGADLAQFEQALMQQFSSGAKHNDAAV